MDSILEGGGQAPSHSARWMCTSAATDLAVKMRLSRVASAIKALVFSTLDRPFSRRASVCGISSINFLIQTMKDLATMDAVELAAIAREDVSYDLRKS